MNTGLVLTTLRLHRAQILITGILLTLLVAAAVLHGFATASFIADHRPEACPSPSCDDLAERVGQRYQMFGQLLPIIGLLPAAIGAFWGAPLLGREFETGTTHFAWTQSISRRTWMVTRMIILGSLVVLGAVVLGTTIDDWLSVFSGFDLPGAAPSDFSFSHMRGTAPVGWWLLGFSIGAASGALLRRTVPAMVVTVIVVIAGVFARNLWFGIATEELTVSAALRLQHLETLALVAVAVLLAALTSWSVEHAHA